MIKIHRVCFNHAIDGITHTFKTQPNLHYHLFFTILAIISGFYFQISRLEWLAIILTINFVIVAEMLNTSIEAMVDLITGERRQDAKIAKDVAAGMVLISAVFSVLIGAIIFIPKIFVIIN